MNYNCDIEYAEYEGQYKRDLDGSVIGCKCASCRQVRESLGVIQVVLGRPSFGKTGVYTPLFKIKL